MNQRKWRPKNSWANNLFSLCVIKSVTSFTTNFPLDFEWAVKIKEVEKIIDNNLINHLSKWWPGAAWAHHSKLKNDTPYHKKHSREEEEVEKFFKKVIIICAFEI